MFAALFLFIIIMVLFLKINHKKNVKALEYKEWMETKGFIHIEIELFDQNEFDYQSTGIVTTTHLVGYVHAGVFNFVLGKNNFCNFELFPEIPNNSEDIKKTAPIILNTGAVKSFKQIDNYI